MQPPEGHALFDVLFCHVLTAVPFDAVQNTNGLLLLYLTDDEEMYSFTAQFCVVAAALRQRRRHVGALPRVGYESEDPHPHTYPCREHRRHRLNTKQNGDTNKAASQLAHLLQHQYWMIQPATSPIPAIETVDSSYKTMIHGLLLSTRCRTDKTEQQLRAPTRISYY